jgi:outer membrane receptor protein involved in Fe transport
MKLDVNTEFYSRISESIGGYYLLNFASRWRAGNNLSFAFEVRNILDRDVYYPAPWPSKVVVDEGRSLWVGLEYSF